jgi:hypothetical protein
MAAHESPRTTKLYDRTADVITLDEVERWATTRAVQTRLLAGARRFDEIADSVEPQQQTAAQK